VTVRASILSLFYVSDLVLTEYNKEVDTVIERVYRYRVPLALPVAINTADCAVLSFSAGLVISAIPAHTKPCKKKFIEPIQYQDLSSGSEGEDSV